MLVRCAPTEDQPDRLTCTLSDNSGPAAYYSATVEMGSGATIAPASPMASLGGRQLDRQHLLTQRRTLPRPRIQVIRTWTARIRALPHPYTV